MALTTALTQSAKERLRFPFEEGCGWKAAAVGGAAVDYTPKISRMGEMGVGTVGLKQQLRNVA